MTTRKLTAAAVTVALYVVLTLGFAPISYGSVQFRISELLNLLAFIDPVYGIGVVAGCVFSNFFSELGLIDVLVGGLSTGAAVFMISRSKNLLVASLWPTIFVVCVAAELSFILQLPFWMTCATVMVGEFGVCTIVGYPLFRIVLRNEHLVRMLRFSEPAKNQM